MIAGVNYCDKAFQCFDKFNTCCEKQDCENSAVLTLKGNEECILMKR